MREWVAPWLAAATLVALIAAVAAIFWPGVPMYDTVAQYRQVIGNMPVDDWHPPVMVRLWQLLHGLAAGAAPMFVAQVALYAAGFALIVRALVRAGRRAAAVAAAILAISPLLLGWQMAVLKDTQMLGALVAATGVIAHFRLASRRIPVPAAAVIALLIAYATLVRANALFATVPLAVLVLPTAKRPFTSAALALVGIAAVLALTPLINHRLLGAELSGVAKMEPLFDLAAISVAAPDAPSPFTPEERAQIASRHCVRAFFWDPLGDPAGCSDATDRLLDEPAGKLYVELARAVVAHPLAYAGHRLAHWNSTERWLVPPGLPEAGPPDEAEPNQVGLGGPQSAAATSWQDVAAMEAGTPLGWPIVWTAIAALLVPVAWRRRGEPAASVALALLASALTLEASFLAISIASDLRYHLWPMAASALALVLLSDGLSPNRRLILTAVAVLTCILAGGLITRGKFPPAPDTYAGMIQAQSG